MEQRCHAISQFANFLDFSFGFIYVIIIIIIIISIFYNPENDNELLASMDIDHPVRIRGKKKTKQYK